MRSLIIVSALLSLVVTQQPVHARDTLVVITQNQYLGADLPAVLGAPDFGAAVVAALEQVAANNFPERAVALAMEVAEWQPDLVGLQEVYDFRCNGGHGEPPFRDHLEDTLFALEALGAQYEAVASVRNLHVENVPIPFPGCATITVTDRDVILARKGVKVTDNSIFAGLCLKPSLDGCNYQVKVPPQPTPIGDINIERGFVGVDVTIGKKDYRFVNTHLELRDIDPTNPLAAAIQAAQAAELIGTLQATAPAGRSVIVVGDMNSSPEHASLPPFFVTPYQQFITQGYHDAWLLRPGNPPEFTCCQLANLSNHQSDLYERIDLIFTSDKPRKVKARLLGQRVSDKTWPERLWPSDHAGVVAELTFE